MEISFYSRTVQEDIDVEVDYSYTPGRAAINKACPGDCEPAEGAEIIINEVLDLLINVDIKDSLCEADIEEIEDKIIEYENERGE